MAKLWARDQTAARAERVSGVLSSGVLSWGSLSSAPLFPGAAVGMVSSP